MRRLGLGAGAALLACLAVMAAGLLGGPGTPLAGWPLLPGAGGVHAGVVGQGRPTPDPTAVPSPTVPGTPGKSSAEATTAASPAASTSQATSTNRVGKTPPGRSHSARPSRSP